MEQITCQSCAHYRQHYVLSQDIFFQVHCGHCTYPKLKTKRPDAKICENYMQSEPKGNPFVTKEYLSRTLLEYVLRLELFPDNPESSD